MFPSGDRSGHENVDRQRQLQERDNRPMPLQHPAETETEGPHAADGECVALLGPRDRGRSVLLDRLAAERDGALLVRRADRLFPQLDVQGNIAFALAARRLGRPERARALGELIAVAGLEGIATLSTRRLAPEPACRVLLARAFATSRPLVLDEPFSELPASERASLQVLLRRLIKQRRTAVVIATSDRQELFACGDRVGIIEEGRPGRVGPVASMLLRPGSAVAARALCDAQLFAGRVAEADADADDADIHLACGAVMPATLSGRVSAGALCLVAVRPDQIAFASVRAEELGGQAIPATMIDLSNFGDHLRLRLRLEDGSQIWIRRPAASLTQRDVDRASEPLGASLAWRASQAIAYPHPQT